LFASGKGQTLQAEPWYQQSAAAATDPGDLRLVLNLEKIVPSPYFRSYWVQKNITDMKQYSAAVSDLFLTGSAYREERVLLKKTLGKISSCAAAGAVPDPASLVPPETGFSSIHAAPSTADTLALIEAKVLAPHSGPGVASQVAPQVQLGSGETGSSADLETRIDQPPLQAHTDTPSAASLKSLFEKASVRASLQIQSTETDAGGVFLKF